MPTLSLTGTDAATSAAVWPADWSQLLPDLIVAIVTGAAVGVFVILAERGIERRGQAQENMARQNAAVKVCAELVSAPLIYADSSLLPLDTDSRRVRQRIQGIPSGPVTKKVYLFHLLTEYVEAWDALEDSAAKLEVQVASVAKQMPEPEDVGRAFRAVIHAGFDDPKNLRSNAREQLHGDWFERDQFRNAMTGYITGRESVEGLQRAFVKSRESRKQAASDAMERYIERGRIGVPIRRRERMLRRELALANQEELNVAHHEAHHRHFEAVQKNKAAFPRS